jgi:preprotein translocase subunit YajC
VGTAWAQTAEGAAPPPFLTPVFLIMVLAVFYFLLVRPEQTRRKQHEKMLGNLKRNDQVVLNAGIHARVIALGDKVLTVEIAPKVPIQVERSAVQSVVRGSSEGREKEREKT